MANNEPQSTQQSQTISSNDVPTDRTEATTADEAESSQSNTRSERVLIETTPTVRPTVIRMIVAIVLSGVAIGGLYTNPELLGSRQVTGLALELVQVLLFIALVRFLIKYIVLRHTKYMITTHVVRRHFSLLGRTKTTEIPFSLIRSAHRSQSRIEYSLGIGTIALNQGLGNVQLSAVPNPDKMYQLIHDRLQTRSTDRQAAT